MALTYDEFDDDFDLEETPEMQAKIKLIEEIMAPRCGSSAMVVAQNNTILGALTETEIAQSRTQLWENTVVNGQRAAVITTETIIKQKTVETFLLDNRGPGVAPSYRSDTQRLSDSVAMFNDGNIVASRKQVGGAIDASPTGIRGATTSGFGLAQSDGTRLVGASGANQTNSWGFPAAELKESVKTRVDREEELTRRALPLRATRVEFVKYDEALYEVCNRVLVSQDCGASFGGDGYLCLYLSAEDGNGPRAAALKRAIAPAATQRAISLGHQVDYSQPDVMAEWEVVEALYQHKGKPVCVINTAAGAAVVYGDANRQDTMFLLNTGAHFLRLKEIL